MARWKALPEGLPSAVVQLVAELRRLKDESGSSLDRLAARTDYSASSWERYLGGRLLPPREAVESLARATGADPVPLLALHQAAREAWQSTSPARAEGVEEPAESDASGEPDEVDEADEADGPTESVVTEAAVTKPTVTEPTVTGSVEGVAAGGSAAPQQAHRGWRTVITSAVAALAGAGIALAVVQPWNGAAACATVAPPVPPIVAAPPHYLCHDRQVNGLWEAGYSTTTTTTTLIAMQSPVVVELQCLLQRAGFTPEGIDGSFGVNTEKAVIQFQMARHLGVDGQVGPQTWGALRR
ncbi:peptidoglycan-binding protein [Streptacidiphilus fuscans]|uniref:Peptidoglycan-binding protein n=1 Tax=Streptacidiphilus fuscans TaxID=2789292 RepID=A0A931B865_9ACTN|nr:peptidoglycan-binding protein [Streptacidiphilus fuscans]MBF9069608.1 peptidoglycan-binding protein [Streptacidiphilus fuscans]